MDDTNEPDGHSANIHTANSASPPVTAPTPRQTATGSMLAAAMLGLGEVIEPEKTRVEIAVEVILAKDSDTGLDLDFGDLPEL
jgi:hypothetical protein